MKNLVMKLWREESGQDLVEYALLVVLIALAAAATFPALATAIDTALGKAETCLNTGTC
ncbi:MAG TPA: hypothetical protein VN577_01855 [Terriglobales bacterium]|nr:hypothetical protein [Terriglobales bacterium]